MLVYLLVSWHLNANPVYAFLLPPGGQVGEVTRHTKTSRGCHFVVSVLRVLLLFSRPCVPSSTLYARLKRKYIYIYISLFHPPHHAVRHLAHNIFLVRMSVATCLRVYVFFFFGGGLREWNSVVVVALLQKGGNEGEKEGGAYLLCTPGSSCHILLLLKSH